MDIHIQIVSSNSFFDSVSTLNDNQCQPFITEKWLKTSFKDVTPELDFVLFVQNEKTVGCAALSKSRNVILGFSEQRLNQTGIHKNDQIWIEYNGIIAAEYAKLDCYKALLNYLCKKGISRFTISMCSAEDYSRIIRCKTAWIDEEKIAGFAANFPQYEPTAQFDIYQTFSANTRAQVRRGNRQLNEKFGKITVAKANTVSEIDHYFEIIGDLHRKQWCSSEEGSGFDNPIFSQILKKQLHTYPEFCSIYCVNAGNETVGLGIFYQVKSTVYFYCSGINHDLTTVNRHIKPGYSMHVALMEYFHNAGYTRYDFLAGDSQYKRSLSNEVVDFYSISIYLNSFRGKILSKLIRLKRFLIGMRLAIR